jgi:myo-inositol-1(or 4)-monophosphatase
VWVALRDEPTFPAVAGRDYGSYALPTLIVSRPELTDVFLPWMETVRISPTSAEPIGT